MKRGEALRSGVVAIPPMVSMERAGTTFPGTGFVTAARRTGEASKIAPATRMRTPTFILQTSNAGFAELTTIFMLVCTECGSKLPV